ncbi:hypothetical protein MRX96_011263 [Rhipicephalus microplus]
MSRSSARRVLHTSTERRRLGSGACRKRASLQMLMLNTTCWRREYDERASSPDEPPPVVELADEQELEELESSSSSSSSSSSRPPPSEKSSSECALRLIPRGCASENMALTWKGGAMGAAALCTEREKKEDRTPLASSVKHRRQPDTSGKRPKLKP